MPTAHGDYYGDDAGVYDDYDAYSDDQSPVLATAWRANGQHQHDPAYETPSEDRSSYQMPTKARQRLMPQDEISRHMMYETALVDCKTFQVLSLDEVETLKQELARLVPRIDAAQRKLILELKVKEAAHNLQKLSLGRRADTPQSSDSPRKRRSTQRSSGTGVDTKQQQLETELLNSQKKVDELNDSIKTLLDRRSQVQGKLLQHTAAVLAQEREQQDAASRHRSFEEDTVSEYEPDAFDGIRDILAGRTISKVSKRIGEDHGISADHEQYFHSMQTRLQDMNEQLRHIIEDVGKDRGVSIAAESRPAPAVGVTAQLDQDLARMESSMAVLRREQKENSQHINTFQIRDSENSKQLENVSVSLHSALVKTTDRDIDHPPPPSNQGHQEHIGYLQSLIASVENMLQSHSDDKAALEKTAGQSQRLNEYETTISGLWDLLAAESAGGEDGSSRTPSTSDPSAAQSQSSRLSESFSLAAFSARVQHIITRANGARDQQDILRRQIQQQRDLNGKSDAEKDNQLQEMQANHDKMLAAHEHLQDELAATMAKHASSENEASQLRAELTKVESEFEQLGKTADAKHQERQELARQVQLHQANHEQARNDLAEVQAQLEQVSAAKSGKDKQMEDLETEVVRLTTELTMAKAELEGAYGSRAERAREAQKGEAEVLKDRSSTLEKELADMTSEFQELTRESLELERERVQLDATIDGLRERCESLEAQLADEKVRWLGNKSAAAGIAEQQTKEQTSMTVLRAEFKKMMRDARLEGVKLLRAEQEQRRALEAELRRLRQANTPLAKTPTA